MIQKSTRRDFIKHSGAMSLGVAWWVGNTAHGFEDSKNPLERLNFACIGVGGKGTGDTDDAAEQGNIVALCDVDENQLNKKAAQLEAGSLKAKDAKYFNFREVKKYQDYRKMFEEMGDKIDAVTVA